LAARARRDGGAAMTDPEPLLALQLCSEGRQDGSPTDRGAESRRCCLVRRRHGDSARVAATRCLGSAATRKASRSSAERPPSTRPHLECTPTGHSESLFWL